MADAAPVDQGLSEVSKSGADDAGEFAVAN